MQNEFQTIAEFAISRPGSIATLERLGIDYCCKGRQSLADACKPAGITPDELFALTARVEATPGVNWNNETLTVLSRYIVDAHHAYTRETVVALGPLAEKVKNRHASNHVELEVVAKLVDQLSADLLPHMLKEEQVLFPYINAIDEASIRKTEPPIPFFGTARNPIRNMMLEHDSVAEILRELRVVTANYDLPDSACASYSALFSQLMSLETDLHQHIHLENNILFPRAIDVEEATRTTPVPAVFMNHVCHGTKC